MTEPVFRALHVVAFRSAVVEKWHAAGWDLVLERLPADSRDAVWQDGVVVATGWVAERHMVKLSEAIFEGPVGGDLEAYRAFLLRVIELGFGRIRRVLVQFAHPHAVLRRAPDLWKHDHSHGELAITIDEKSALAFVTHPVLTTTQLSRFTAAEMFRAVLSLTSAKEVKQEHGLDGDGRLRVLFKWA